MNMYCLVAATHGPWHRSDYGTLEDAVKAWRPGLAIRRIVGTSTGPLSDPELNEALVLLLRHKGGAIETVTISGTVTAEPASYPDNGQGAPVKPCLSRCPARSYSDNDKCVLDIGHDGKHVAATGAWWTT